MRGRDTAEETAQFVAAIVDAVRAHRIFKVLISIRESRPIFKVEDWRLSAVLDQMKDTPGLKAAFVATGQTGLLLEPDADSRQLVSVDASKGSQAVPP
jgi:hypothetical protein